MKADGSILIDTKIVDGGMEKGFELIKDEMSSVGLTAKKVGEQIELSFSKMDVSKPIANAVAKVQQLESQLASITSEQQMAISEDDDKSAERLAARRIAAYDRLEAAREKLSIELAHAVQKEAEAEERAAQRAIRSAEKEAAAKQKAADKQMKALTKSTRHFGSRLREIVSGALVFNLISAGLRNVTRYFGSALKSNNEFNAAFSQLKGTLLTAFQPIYEVVAPALIYLIRLLTMAAQVVGQFFAAISGKSYGTMQKNAEALYKQANGLEAVGGAAEEAKKQLMGFDEINKLESNETASGGGGSAAVDAPTFSELEDPKLMGQLEDILRLVGAVGAALLTWKIASAFTNSLSLAAGLALAVGGGILYATSWADAFANGIDWGNLSGMLLGMITLAGGLALAFGPVGAAIGLLIASVGLVVIALKEWIETGKLSDEACVALIAGITGIGAAISLLTGSWIPLLLAAVVAFVIAAKEKGDEIKQIFEKAIQWFKDTFLRDWTEIFGEKLGSQLNNFFLMCSDILEAVGQIFGGLIDFIQNAFARNWAAAWDGLASAAKGAVNIIISVVNAMIRAVTDAINALFRLLSINIELPGGGSIGWSLPQFTAPQIPYLAQGAVIPPNREFLAVLGDQTHGNNIEAPEDLIRQIVREESGKDSRVAELLEILIATVEGIEVGDEVIGRAASRYNRRVSRAGGY